MEGAPKVNKKDLKKQFKAVYPKHDPEKTKVVSTETATQIIIECMTNCGQTYSAEEAQKILGKFDVDSNGQVAKNEVKSALMIAAKIEELTEKMIMKMKKKWEKKQNKKKKATKEQKKERKQLKKKLKEAFKATLKPLPYDKHDFIGMGEAESLVTSMLASMELKVDESAMRELLASIDCSNAQGVTKKELKIACAQLAGMRDVDLERAHQQRTKIMLKKEKKEMKRMKKEEKQKAKEAAKDA